MIDIEEKKKTRYFNDPKFYALVNSFYENMWRGIFNHQDVVDALEVADFKIECEKEKELKRQNQLNK